MPTQTQVSTPCKWESPCWPHEESDLKPDPSLKFGRFTNGFRYVFKENATPSDRVSMHLYVEVGSLMESETQQGMAHFLEHMQFNGSTHFAPDEMVQYFQRIGMQFGPDANAHTGFSETVYDILLPAGDSSHLAEGMLVLRDFAHGALLLPEQIEQEKKVVLAEKRSRDSADLQIAKATFAFEMPGALPPKRFPIGREETINRFNQSMLRQFYDLWYRPERMVLVIVGQFDIDEAQKLAEKYFADLLPSKNEAEPPEFGTFRHQGLKAFYYPEKEAGSATVRIETMTRVQQPPETAEQQHQRVLEMLANKIVNHRLQDLARQESADITEASIGSGFYLKQLHYAAISAQSEPQNWAKALENIEQMLRQALEFGFTQGEVQRAKKEFSTQLQKALDEEATRDSGDIAADLLRSLRRQFVMRSAVQDEQFLTPFIETITPQQLHQALIANWSKDHRLVMVTGDTDLSREADDPLGRIKAVYLQSESVAVMKPESEKEIQFPYLPDPPQSQNIQMQSSIKDLDIEQIEFANGIHLVMKKTPFKSGEVLSTLSFGYGQASQPAHLPGLADLTEELLNEAGFGKMERTEVEKALAGHPTKISLRIREEVCEVEGQSVTGDLPLLFQLLYAFISDPGYRPETLALARKQLVQEYTSAIHDVQGVMQIKGERFLSGEDNRFGLASPEDLAMITLDQIEEWFTPQLNNSPMEIAIVGDFDPEVVKSLAQHYLGALPSRKSAAMTSPAVPGPKFPTGQRATFNTDSQIDKALVVISYPTEDFWDIQRTRRLSILASVFNERLRTQIREKLGAAYSPVAYNRPYRAYPGFGTFRVYLLVDPKQSDMVVEEVMQIADALARQPIGQDEFRRSLDPILTRLKDQRQSNVYWLRSVLSGSGRHPQQVDWARTMADDYAAITIEEIQQLAATYLVNTKAAIVIIQSGN